MTLGLFSLKSCRSQEMMVLIFMVRRFVQGNLVFEQKLQNTHYQSVDYE